MTRSEMALTPCGSVKTAFENLEDGSHRAGTCRFWKRLSARAHRHAIERQRLAEERAVEPPADKALTYGLDWLERMDD